MVEVQGNNYFPRARDFRVMIKLITLYYIYFKIGNKLVGKRYNK